MATIFKLIIEDDEGKTTVYPLADGDLTIGRKDGNTIRLMERNVSRRHARLERTNGAVYIQDLDSYNGVKINGERITGKYEVKEGDLVEIGDYHLALQKSVTRSEAPEPAMAGNSTWPQAGTVPDFALPNELLGDERSPRDTIIDQPVPASVPAKVIAKTVDERPKPLPAPDTQGRLPPFPSSSSALPEPSSAQDSSLPTLPPKSELAPGPDVLSSMPRLICVSTTYAGKSYTLTRPELIIGRVEDNDIVIEHRSVSRNHAKILFDGRTHKIIDLQSANGILVNGEEYAMTDLRKGDLIELGHVRFRFVPADEPFRPTAEEAQEMQAAGVASPLSESDDPDEPLDAAARPVTADLPNQYDASQAQTVTDAPLNALEPSVPNPVVEPAASAPVSSPLTAPLTAPIPGRPLPQNDERPTELNRAPTAIPVPAPAVESNVPSYRAPTAIDPPMPPRRPKRRFGMFFAVLLLAAAVFATVVVLFEFIGPANDPDTRLARLFNEERYAEVVALYERNPNAFSEPDQAEGYYRAAGSLSAEAAMPLEVEDPDNGFELDPSDMEPDAVDVELPPDASSPTTPEPPIAEPTPPDQAEPDEATSDEAAALAARRRRRAEAARRAKQRTNQIRRLISQARQQIIQGKLDLAAKTLKECLRLDPRQQSCHQLQVRRLGALGDKQILSGDLVAASKTVKESLRLYPKQSGTRLIQLKFLVELGKRQLIEGKFESAEATLKQCLKLNPRQPACHRNLGVLFARQDQTTSAIRHYRRYIELQPDANDAPRVREILKKFEGSP